MEISTNIMLLLQNQTLPKKLCLNAMYINTIHNILSDLVLKVGHQQAFYFKQNCLVIFTTNDNFIAFKYVIDGTTQQDIVLTQ